MRRLSRRTFLAGSISVALGSALAACGQPTAAPTSPAQPTAVPAATPVPDATSAPEATSAPAPTAVPAAESTYNEPPLFADRVASGELPPIDERLPKVPKLANEMDPSLLNYEIGRYGGTMRSATALTDRCPDATVSSREPLVNTPGILGEEFTPNIVEGFEISSDQKEFIFRLREGLRWSDGELVTMEDFRFTIEDVLFNTEVTSAIPAWLKTGNNAGGDPFTFEIIDDETFKFAFSEPYGGFPLVLAIKGWRDYAEVLKPAHYLKPFHKDYADEGELEAAIAEAGVDTWVQLFTSKDVLATQLGYAKAVGFPMIRAWILKETGTERFVFERNPYYHKVDSAGNQLPYMDNWVVILAQDIETVAMMHIAGEVGFARESASLVKMPLYRENEERGGFVARLARMHVTPTNVALNLTYDDPVWREVVQDLRFRRALNYAIDRDEIIDAVYLGHAEPSTIIDSEFSIEKANALLDEMGMDQRDGDGFRLGPDGNTFVIPIEVGAEAPDIVPVGELFVQFWEAVGIRTTLATIASQLRGQRGAANELQATVGWSHTPLWYMADWYQGWSGAPLWVSWWTTQGEQGEEPPEEFKEFYAALDSISVLPPEEGLQAFNRAREIFSEIIPFFVHVENVKQPLLTDAKLGNVSGNEDAFAIASNFAGEQFFFRE